MKNYRHKFQTTSKPLSEINVVPYIDVMLVLLVIFMITAPLLSQGVHVNLPQAKAKALSANEQLPLVVSVDQFGRYYLNVADKPKQPINGQQLMTQVAAQLTIAKRKHQTLPVYVEGDRAVDYGKVVQAMVLLQQAGAQNVGLVTQQFEAPQR